MKWHRLYKESDEQVNLKKLLKQNGVTKLPSGMKFSGPKAEWHKDGGYAGDRILSNMRGQVVEAGWSKTNSYPGITPDGSYTGEGYKYLSPDGQIIMSYYSYHGVTASDNSYSITFKLVGDSVNESRDDMMIATLVKIDENGEKEIDMRQVVNGYDAIKLMEDYATSHADDDDWVAEKYAMFASGEDDKGKMQAGRLLEKNGEISEKFLNGGYEIQLRLYDSAYNESSRFGFNVGDKVELKVGKEPNRFGGWGKIEAGTQGEIVAIDKPMPGAIKVKLDDGTVVTMGERQLKLAGTDNEPWKSLAANRPPEPKRDVRPERPEDYYMRPTSYGSPRYTGD